MPHSDEHSRRDFLQGRAAVRVAASKAQQWVDSTSELLAASSSAEPVAHIYASRRAMACEFAVQYHEADAELGEAVLAAFDLIEQIEDQLTIYRDESEVIDLNQRAYSEAIEVDHDLFELLLLSQRLHLETEAAFDITSGPLSYAWGFFQRAGRFPDADELSTALVKVDGSAVMLDQGSQSVKFRNECTQINFNSLGKGYALDQVAKQLDAEKYTDYLWHGGGSSVLARGRNRCEKLARWSVGLKHPFKSNQRLAEFHLADRALATAGGATQYFEHDGKRYSHIIDPRTGWPAEGVYTTTVLAPSAAEADGLATAFFVMDVEAVEAYCQRHPEISAVLVSPASEAGKFVVQAFGMNDSDWTC